MLKSEFCADLVSLQHRRSYTVNGIYSKRQLYKNWTIQSLLPHNVQTQSAAHTQMPTKMAVDGTSCSN